MSLLTPVKVPVKAYKWDDVGAPALDKTAGCVATIFKACLVTGYGNKEAAGWTMPFEDAAAGVKVLRPAVEVDTNWFMRLSADNGRGMAVQIYRNMTDVNTGDKKMECSTPFHYGGPVTSGKWILIASPKGVWFFAEAQSSTATKLPLNQSGTYLFAGNVPSDSSTSNVYMRHSGGTYGATWGEKGGITDPVDGGSVVAGLLYNPNTDTTSDAPVPFSLFNGDKVFCDLTISAPLYLNPTSKILSLPIYVPSKNTMLNFDTVNEGGLQAINCCTRTLKYSGANARDVSNVLISTDEWVY